MYNGYYCNELTKISRIVISVKSQIKVFHRRICVCAHLTQMLYEYERVQK